MDRLVRAVGKDDPRKWGRDDLLATSVDHMLAAGQTKPALAVWAILKDGGWLTQSVPDEQNPLTNGDFSKLLYRHGFDWAATENTGTRVAQDTEGPELHISFYGDESENITLLQQFVAVAPGAKYTMTWSAESEDISEPSGLIWHLHAVDADGAADVVSGDLMSPLKAWSFVAPPSAKAFLLTLEYSRQFGPPWHADTEIRRNESAIKPRNYFAAPEV